MTGVITLQPAPSANEGDVFATSNSNLEQSAELIPTIQPNEDELAQNIEEKKKESGCCVCGDVEDDTDVFCIADCISWLSECFSCNLCNEGGDQTVDETCIDGCCSGCWQCIDGCCSGCWQCIGDCCTACGECDCDCDCDCVD